MVNYQHHPQKSICPVCEATDIAILIEMIQVPIHCNVLWPTHEEAICAPRGDIRPGFCRSCGHIFNLVFNPGLMEYTQAYENSLHFSPRFQSYVESLAARLIDRYDLRNKDIIDIGCGKGDFLKLICELGGNRGVGFDPSYVPDQGEGRASGQVTFIQDFYSERYAGYQADLICCRHVLEHIQFPRDFLKSIRQSIESQRGTVLFFEVPNVLYTLRDLGIWDLIYEHCCYFSASSLYYLFKLSGFDLLDLSEMYEGQFLVIEAFLSRENSVFLSQQSERSPHYMADLVMPFADRYRSKIETWRQKIEQMMEAGQRVVVWGSGSKGVTFLNVLETRDQIEYVVDINPRKQGMYVAGTGQKIVPPEFLRDYRPDAIIIMNPIYQTEIQQMVAGLGFTPQFLNAS